MEKNNLNHVLFFFRAHLSFYQQPKHKAKVKVQPLLCSFPLAAPCLPPRVVEPRLGPFCSDVAASPAWLSSLPPVCVLSRIAAAAVAPQVMLRPPCAHHREMDSVWLFGNPHLTSLLLPENKVLGAGKYGDDIKQLLPRLGEAEQGCPHEHSSSMSPQPLILAQNAQQLPAEMSPGMASCVQPYFQDAFYHFMVHAFTVGTRHPICNRFSMFCWHKCSRNDLLQTWV